MSEDDDRFAGIPDAPKLHEPNKAFLSSVEGVLARAEQARQERQRLDAIEADEASDAAMREHQRQEAMGERAAEEAERQAVAEMAAKTEDPSSPGDNVIPMRRAEKTGPQEENGEHGEFFAVDHNLWERVCSLGLNATVAYVILARGTGGDNRTSSWSVNAIEKYTAISRAHANEAIQTLIKAGLVRQDRGGSRPQYYLMPFNEVGPPPVKLSREELRIFQTIEALVTKAGVKSVWVPKVGRHDNEWSFGRPHETAAQLAQRKVLVSYGEQHFGLPASADAVAPVWVWLPNAMVKGVGTETPPIELVRQSLSVEVLRLLVDLYAAHSLPSNGGVDWRMEKGIRQSFDRKKVGENGIYAIWAWKPGNVTAGNPPGWSGFRGASEKGIEADSKAFFDAVRELKRTGLIEYVAHLVEDPEHEAAQIIHPIPHLNGEVWEKAISEAAWNAAVRLSLPESIERAIAAGWRIYAPVEARREAASVVGVLRLRYKPKTKATALWVQQAEAQAGKFVQKYDRLGVPDQGQENGSLAT